MSGHHNRLAQESSPYLLQHAHNPVDWYPWGAEALARAHDEDRPILLSIGYAACHWCHVMERESFENELIAKRMNELFVNIKVDREERPDLDQIYQLVVQLMGRSGGWPLTVFLTPDQKPFFAGTYFPPHDRYGMPGFPKVLEAVAEAYRQRRPDVESQAQDITDAIEHTQTLPKGDDRTLGPDLLRLTSRKLLARMDARYGGFGPRPKFPNTMALDVLLRRGVLEGDGMAKESVERALDKMRQGGIWDHLRGGFHRYSTDERWLVPHFEKMLYDNALLLRLYVDGFRAFQKPLYADTAREIVGYLFAEMKSVQGAFYASQDADSEGHEGKFFVWTLTELRDVVEGDDIAYHVARVFFGITEEGNFEDSGATVLSQPRTIEQTAKMIDIEVSVAAEALVRAKAKMLAARDKRIRPARDDKVLASWNALLIGALADAGRTLGEPTWIDAAVSAFAEIQHKLMRDGRVSRYIKDGLAVAPDRAGFLDDQAYLGNAALDLYEATGLPEYVSIARSIADAMIAHHWNHDTQSFFFTPDDGDSLIARTRDFFDHAVPSGTSMACLLSLRLSDLVDTAYLAPAERQLHALATMATENPFGLGQTVCVLDRLVRGATSIVVVGDANHATTKALVDTAFTVYIPSRTIVMLDPNRVDTMAAARLLAEGKMTGEGGSVAYVCRGQTCSAPVSNPEALAKLLQPEALS